MQKVPQRLQVASPPPKGRHLLGAEDASSTIAAGHGRGKRKALKAFLHKLRHPAVTDAEAAPAHNAAHDSASRGEYSNASDIY